MGCIWASVGTVLVWGKGTQFCQTLSPPQLDVDICSEQSPPPYRPPALRLRVPFPYVGDICSHTTYASTVVSSVRSKAVGEGVRRRRFWFFGPLQRGDRRLVSGRPIKPLLREVLQKTLLSCQLLGRCHCSDHAPGGEPRTMPDHAPGGEPRTTNDDDSLVRRR